MAGVIAGRGVSDRSLVLERDAATTHESPPILSARSSRGRFLVILCSKGVPHADCLLCRP